MKSIMTTPFTVIAKHVPFVTFHAFATGSEGSPGDNGLESVQVDARDISTGRTLASYCVLFDDDGEFVPQISRLDVQNACEGDFIAEDHRFQRMTARSLGLLIHAIAVAYVDTQIEDNSAFARSAVQMLRVPHEAEELESPVEDVEQTGVAGMSHSDIENPDGSISGDKIRQQLAKQLGVPVENIMFAPGVLEKVEGQEAPTNERKPFSFAEYMRAIAGRDRGAEGRSS